MWRGKEIKREQMKEEKELVEKVTRLERCIEGGSPETIIIYERAKGRLDEFKPMKGQIVILASGVRRVEQCEKPSKYFLDLGKKRAMQTSIASLKSGTGEILDENMTILKYCESYFKELFKSGDFNLESMAAFSLADDDPRLSEEEMMSLEERFFFLPSR